MVVEDRGSCSCRWSFCRERAPCLGQGPHAGAKTKQSGCSQEIFPVDAAITSYLYMEGRSIFIYRCFHAGLFPFLSF